MYPPRYRVDVLGVKKPRNVDIVFSNKAPIPNYRPETITFHKW